MLISLQTRRYCKQTQDPCKNKDMLRTHLSLCTTKSIKVDLENKEMDKFLERLVPPSRLFRFLAEFPPGAWRLTLSTYLPWLLRPTRGSPRWGTLHYSSGRQWPNVDCTSSLSWNFIGFPCKPSYSASFLH